MSDGPVTTNPFLIMLINMTVVFMVLWLLGCLIRLIYYIDPTRKKKSDNEILVAAMKPASKTVPNASKVKPDDLQQKELIAVITTAIMAYGYRDVRISSIKPIHRK